MPGPLIRVFVLLLLATVLAVAATRVFNLSGESEDTNEANDRVEADSELVTVANRNLEAGAPLKAGDLRVESWPTALLPEGTEKDPEAIEGRVLRVPVATGIPLLEATLLPPGASTEMDWHIEVGHRAMTIRTTSSGGLAGFVFPGSRVDVLATLEAPDSARNVGIVAATIAHDVRVLATDQEMSRDPSAERDIVELVTLEVTPEEAERLLLGFSEGDLHLVLRSGEEHALSGTEGATARDLVPARYSRKTVQQPQRRPKRRSSVSVIRGVDTTAEGI